MSVIGHLTHERAEALRHSIDEISWRSEDNTSLWTVVNIECSVMDRCSRGKSCTSHLVCDLMDGHRVPTSDPEKTFNVIPTRSYVPRSAAPTENLEVAISHSLGECLFIFISRFRNPLPRRDLGKSRNSHHLSFPQFRVTRVKAALLRHDVLKDNFDW
ncbi:hypothetical protein SCLCIDRAFT_964776 [Scleroderma citrinum Foug A]|uniref:Uncharacterized protein n=1 Tax=Scleroderma citrinum Foug A TaxID=1036808 RepID=A0A0C3DVM7_9AGAM|nr:hypothetical protein SCLCIDRAFT_964776 [Scleroderma citrinum Foug A]